MLSAGMDEDFTAAGPGEGVELAAAVLVSEAGIAAGWDAPGAGVFSSAKNL